MVKNGKSNEEAAMNLNLSQADMFMSKDIAVNADYIEAPKSEIDQKLSKETDAKKLKKIVDLGDVF